VSAGRARRVVRAGLSWIGEPDWGRRTSRRCRSPRSSRDLRRRHSRREAFAAALPDEWVDQLAVTGTPLDARARLARLDGAGSRHAVLIPAGPDALGALTSLARVLPAGSVC
jgi:hypothetical protein